MESKIESILKRVKERAHAQGGATDLGYSGDVAYPLVTAEEIIRVESDIRYQLPQLLRRMYLEVGNGGFGPGYGLLTLVPLIPSVDRSAHAIYRSRTNGANQASRWSRGTFPFNNWGSGILSCLDLEAGNSTPVFRFDPNIPLEVTRKYLDGSRELGAGLFKESDSLIEWFESWLDGKEMFNSAASRIRVE